MEGIALFKIFGVGILTLVCYIIVKPIKPDIAVFVSLIGSCIIIMLCINSFASVINSINNFIQKTKINSSVLILILKIIGIGYLTEFASGLCNDAGCGTLSEKITFAGKISILVMSMPIVTNLLNIIVEIL